MRTSLSVEGYDPERSTTAKTLKEPTEMEATETKTIISLIRLQRAGERLSVRTVNEVWDKVCKFADVKGKTPHSARHAMGKHIIEKTGNIAAVQRQLGHKNAVYSMQYAQITAEELRNVIDER